MKVKIFNVIKSATRMVVTIGTTLGTFCIELVLVEKTIPFHGAAKLTTAFSKVGKAIKVPTMMGGLVTMVATSAFVGNKAGDAVDQVFDWLRSKQIFSIFSVQECDE